MGGRWCDIKIPESQDRKDAKGQDKSSCKIFVGRITENLTKEDLRDHFEAFGQVTDVYVPSPFRHFAFVQFSESKVAQSLLGKEHIIKGVSVKIGEASPKGREQGGGRDHDRGGNRFGGYDGGYDRALVTVALGPTVGMEQQGGVMEQIKEGSEEETQLLVEEVPGVIVDRGTRIEDFQVMVLVLDWVQDCALPGKKRQRKEYSFSGAGRCQEL